MGGIQSTDKFLLEFFLEIGFGYYFNITKIHFQFVIYSFIDISIQDVYMLLSIKT